jgi:hypothetical protein
MVHISFINDLVLFIEANTKLFKIDQYKCKYQVVDIIEELFNILKNNSSYVEYNGPIDKGSLFYTHNLLLKSKIFEKYYKFLIKRYFANCLREKLKYTISISYFNDLFIKDKNDFDYLSKKLIFLFIIYIIK